MERYKTIAGQHYLPGYDSRKEGRKKLNPPGF
jgi:hypothetical protein